RRHARPPGAGHLGPRAPRPRRRRLLGGRRLPRRAHARRRRLRPLPSRRQRLGARRLPRVDRLPAAPLRSPRGRAKTRVAYGGSFWGRRPFAWVGFVLALLCIPLVGYALQGGRSFVELLPSVNACLNATSAAFLLGGYIAVRKKNIALHWRFMLSAALASTV